MNRVTEDWAKAVGLTDSKGALVIGLVKGGPAEFAGVQPGDVIVKFDKVNIASAAELPRIVADTPLGSSVELEVWRTGNGPGDLVRWLNDRAVKEDATAIKSMAVAYGLGFAGLNDATEGVRWYRRAADLGDSSRQRLWHRQRSDEGSHRSYQMVSQGCRPGQHTGHDRAWTSL